MVSFRNILVSALAATPAFAAVTPAQIVSNINALTQKSQALQGAADNITLINGPLIIVGQGPFPKLITGFSDIVSTASSSVTAMGSAPQKVTKASDATDIYDAYREFVRVHQNLLSTLIGKAGLFNTLPFIGQPIAAVLRQDESIVDTIAFSLIETVPSRAADLEDQQNLLDPTLQTAITAYEGLSLQKRSARPISRVMRGMVAAAA